MQPVSAADIVAGVIFASLLGFAAFALTLAVIEIWRHW